MTVKGVRVAFLAYTELTNGIPLAAPVVGQPRQRAADHRRRPPGAHRGAQIVIVNMHWGDEYVSQPSSFQLQLASKLTRSPDITAIVGQHVHVVQPIRFINGKPVVFGEGNLISDQTSACCPAATQDGMIVAAHHRRGRPRARVTRSVTCRSGSGTRTVGYPAGHMTRLLQRTCLPARRMAISRIIAILIMASELPVRRS